MKKIISCVVLFIVASSCFGDGTIATNANTEGKSDRGPVSTNGGKVEDVEPASTEMLRNYEQHPENYKSQDLLGIGIGYIYETNTGKATTVLKSFLSVETNNVQALRALGDCYELTGEYDLAIAQFKKAWALGDDLSLLDMANTCCFFANRFQDLKPLLPDLYKLRDRLDDKDDKHQITNVLLAYALHEGRESGKQFFLNAIRGLSDDFIMEREDTANLALHGFEVFGEADRGNRLREEFTRRKEAMVFCQKAKGKEAAGDNIGAIADYSKAIELQPEAPVIYYNRGNIESELERYEAALADYNKAIDLDPEFGFAYHNRGNVKFRLKDPSGAVRDYSKEIEIDPTNALAYQDRGKAENFLCRWRPALEDFQKALQLDPTLDDSRLSVWLLSTRLGEEKDATKELAAYLQLQPMVKTNSWAAEIERYFVDAVTQDELISTAEADATMKYARLCRAYYYIGMKSLVSGDTIKADEFFHKALNTKAKTSVEYHNAEAELNALKGSVLGK